MLHVRATIHYTGIAAAKAKDLQAVARAETEAAGGYWHEAYLPLHFKPAAFALYGSTFKPRGRKYTARKGGDTSPMVFSGTMRNQVLGFARIASSGKSTRVTVTGVRALNLSSRKNFPDFRAEITAITGQEVDRMARRIDAGVHRRLDAATWSAEFGGSERTWDG